MAHVELSPSLLAADFTCLRTQIDEAVRTGVERFHMDVMDGRFVPNITFGPLVVAAARRCTSITIEAHLMIVEPDRWVPDFAKAGADIILVHQEACSHLHGTLQQIHRLGKKAGVVVNPATPLFTIADILPEVDQVLVMSVNPGFGGQTFIESSVEKIANLRAMIEERKLSCAIEVDGGIAPDTAPAVVKAGARVLVAGASIFRSPDGITAAIGNLRRSAEAALG